MDVPEWVVLAIMRGRSVAPERRPGTQVLVQQIAARPERDAQRLVLPSSQETAGSTTSQPPLWGLHLATQAEELRARDSRVETILPDSVPRPGVPRPAQSGRAAARVLTHLHPAWLACRPVCERPCLAGDDGP